MGIGLLISQRSTGYKIGLFLAFISVVCYAIGFSAPNWTIYSVSLRPDIGEGSGSTVPWLFGDFQGHNGLWETCSVMQGFGAFKTCTSISHHRGDPAWMSGVQGVQTVGLVGLVFAFLYAGGLNLVSRTPFNNRYLEVLLLLSGMLGFTGCTLYAAQSYGNDHVLMSEDDYEYYYHHYDDAFAHYGDYTLTVKRNELAWAFGVSLTGCLLAIISAVVIYTQNRYIPSPEPRPGANVAPAAARAFTGGALVFLPPEQLAGGFSPPSYSTSETLAAAAVGGHCGGVPAMGYEASHASAPCMEETKVAEEKV